jgi:exodeoxyribonuclease VII large subunit
LFALLTDLVRRGTHCLSRHADRARERLELTACRWPRPESLLAQPTQRNDELGERLPRALAARAAHARGDLNAVAPRLRPQLLQDRLARAGDRLAALWTMATLVHPDRPLSKGFARVTSRAGKTVTRVADALAERLVTLHFGDGQVAAAVGDDAPAPRARRVEPARQRSYLPPQPGLFDDPAGQPEE